MPGNPGYARSRKRKKQEDEAKAKRAAEKLKKEKTSPNAIGASPSHAKASPVPEATSRPANACKTCGSDEKDKLGKCAKCWSPSAPQARFLSLTCFEALFGGAAGGGKSDALLIDATRYIGRGYGSSYAAILLRREFPELEKSLIVRSQALYPNLGGVYRQDKRLWTFPAGERIYFGHAQHDKDILQYQGAEFQFVAFDELTHFTEYQYKYMISRMRSSKGVPLRLRAATNPGGEGHEWVMRRFAPWLDPESQVHADPGKVLYFVHQDEKEVIVEKGTPGSLGRVFVPARISDNPHIAGSMYERGLDELDPVTRARLKDGNWLIKPAKGELFKRQWFEFVDSASLPKDLQTIRYWDRAATVAAPGKDPDWTVGLKMARDKQGIFYILDVYRIRDTPAQVEAAIRWTAELDGLSTTIGIEKDPGQAGKFEADYYVRSLAGFDIRVYPISGDKKTRARGASAQAERGNIKLLRGEWNSHFLQELEAFPEGSHDDQVDALSGAFHALAKPPVTAAPISPEFLRFADY